jgi:signal transduction histidine kinase
VRNSISRLYLRMAFYIGTALIAFILLGAISLAIIASYELRGYSSAKDSPLAREAATLLTSKGEPGLIEWLELQELQREDITLYVLDENSQDLLGRPLPAQLDNFVRNSVISPPVDQTNNLLPIRLAPQLVSPEGRLLTFLILPRDFSFWGSRLTLLGLLVAALVVTSGVAWLIARAFGRPIRELQFAVRELSLGHVQARVPESIAARRDELGDLAADFNRMADQLDHLITGSEQLMQELSHELRAPLARLQAALALAAERQSLPAGQRKQIDDEIHRMNDVIGELLHYSRIKAVGAPEKRLFRLDRLLQDIVSAEDVEAQAMHCQLQMHCDANLYLVGDPELMRRGFENIIRNALRHAPQDSKVEIQARKSRQEIVAQIQDRGSGVSEDKLQSIFDPFIRAGNNSDNSQGTGLGLAIAKRVFELHDGRVAASNRGGGGLAVEVILPAAELT